MAYGMEDLVREQATFAGGTGAVTLPVSPVSGFQTFLSGWGASGTGEYKISIGPQWETGFGTLNAGGSVLTRSIIYNGSSGVGVSVNFSAGTMDCTGVVPAELAHHTNLREITVASAATCDIGAVRSAAIAISGTVTITSLGTSKNRWRLVRFTGALTLTHNATTLILPRAENITTAAGDCMTAVSDASGNWRIYNYLRADGNIKFAATQSASADANTLDDYEEGTWTPVFTVGGSTAGVTYGTQVGHYQKVGNRVHWQFCIILTNNGSGTGSVTITGLPFTTNSTTHFYSPGYGSMTNGSAGGALVIFAAANTTTLNLLSASNAPLSDTTTADNSILVCGGSYEAEL
jgi:hypothetical protein